MPDNKQPLNHASTASQLVVVTGDTQNDDITRIDRFQSLTHGTYWRLTRGVEENGYSDCLIVGKVHLITKLNYADGKIHSVEVQAHPGSDYPTGSAEYLVQEFLECFEFAPEGLSEREQEIAGVQQMIQDKQAELCRISTDPTYVLGLLSHEAEATDDEPEEECELNLEAGLPDPGAWNKDLATVAKSDVKRLTAQLSNQRIIAETQSNLLQERTNDLQETISSLAPYYTERGLAAKASASEAIEYIKKIEEGLATLGLYTGDGIEVVRHCQGESADKSEPLSLRQRLLFMDQESLINVAEGGADFEDMDTFLEMLHKDPELLQRVLPEPRGIVAIQFRRSGKDYGYTNSLSDALAQAGKNIINKYAFLLIRDGENLSTVQSPLTHMTRLFPTKDDTDMPFRGYDGERITIDDIEYSRVKKRSNDISLHFKRILILLWGLYDREENIFGPLAVEDVQGHVNLLSGAIQKELFRFIYDDEPDTLLGEARPSFRDWVNGHNELLQSGSQVGCFWNDMLKEELAPACVVEHAHMDYDRTEVRYCPEKDAGVEIAQMVDNKLVVKPLVKSTDSYRYKKKPFYATFKLDNTRINRGYGFLCLDNVNHDDVNWYIYSREHRTDYLSMIPLLVGVRDLLEQERPARDGLANTLMDGLKQGGLIEDDKGTRESIYDIMRMWRASNRGRPYPVPGDKDYLKIVNTLFDQLWWLSADALSVRVSQIETLCAEQGRKPLRLVISGKGYLAVYTTENNEERETRFGKHVWVKRIVLVLRKNKVSFEREKWVQLSEFRADERVVHEWDEGEVSRYTKYAKRPYNYQHVVNAFELASSGREKLLSVLSGENNRDKIIDEFIRYTDVANARNKSRYVHVPVVAFPVGVCKLRPENNGIQKYGLVILSTKTTSLAYWAGNADSRKAVTTWIKRTYSKPSHAIANVTGGECLDFDLHISPVVSRVIDAFGKNAMWLSKDKYYDLPSCGPGVAPSGLSEGREDLASYKEHDFFGRRRKRVKMPVVTMIDWADDDTEEQIDTHLCKQ